MSTKKICLVNMATSNGSSDFVTFPKLVVNLNCVSGSLITILKEFVLGFKLCKLKPRFTSSGTRTVALLKEHIIF